MQCKFDDIHLCSIFSFSSRPAEIVLGAVILFTGTISDIPAMHPVSLHYTSLNWYTESPRPYNQQVQIPQLYAHCK